MKRGIKTTEFWLTAIVAILSIVTPTLVQYFGSEESFPAWAKSLSIGVGSVLSVFATLGYVKGRTSLKESETKLVGYMENEENEKG